MLKSICIVGIGSFVGGALRFLISIGMKGVCTTQGFPWGTLLVNLLGCLIIGIVCALFGRYSSTSGTCYLLLTTGFCGGFTTFSTFANESLQMLQNGQWGGFLAYTSISLIAGIGLTAVGYWIAK